MCSYAPSAASYRLTLLQAFTDNLLLILGRPGTSHLVLARFAIPQVVQLRSPHLAPAKNLDALQCGRVPAHDSTSAQERCIMAWRALLPMGSMLHGQAK